MEQRTHDETERDREASALARLLNKRVVTIGGGTGPYAVLSSLKRYPCAITAVVSMADSGGSSRRLMDEFGQLPLGDLRQALVALSRKGALWRDVFTFRFRRGKPLRPGQEGAERGQEVEGDPSVSGAQRAAQQAGVGGHSLGNLIIAALQDINDGNLLRAIEDAQELLDTAGKVLPVTLEHTTLCAELQDGATICGETEIDTRGLRQLGGQGGPLAPITRVFLQQETPACEEALRAIRRADVLVIGPGDLYTSILPNLLVEGVAEAVRQSEAQKIYICNLMTKHGETDGYRAADFVRQVHAYLGGRVDRVIAHDGSFPEELVDRYAAQEQHPVVLDEDAVRQLVPDVIVDKLLAIHQDHLVRHDADRLVRAIFAPLSFQALRQGVAVASGSGAGARGS
ncbi:MAG TPA: gluconeogenesis factor YvcK family protein [Ktedonobacterales bacterium]|nr:gluconeogenesis factor YvcK family protein [Ktedonobacterales bacterium]